MSDETTAEMLAEIDKDLADIEKAVSALQQQAAQANYPQPVETTTDRLAEIEEQSEPQPVQIREGRWRTRGGEIRNITLTPDGDSRAIIYPWHDARCDQTWLSSGRYHTVHTESPLDLWEYLGPIEPEAEPEQPAADYTPPEGWRALQVGDALQPGDAWAHPQADLFEENLNLTGVAGSHGYYLRRQVCEGRWRTRGGKEISVTAMPTNHTMYLPGYPWWDGDVETWKNDGGYYKNGEALEDLVKYLGPNLPEPEKIITPDDVAAEALAGVFDQGKAEQQITELQAQVNFLKGRELTLGTRLQDEKAVSTKRLQQVEELRSEVSHVQGLLGESSRRIVELETLVADLRAVNAAQEKAVNSADRDKADLESRLRAVAAEFGVQLETNNRLQTQLEAVKAELVQQCETSRRLQIELDAREQVPQAVSDRFEEGWDKGTARAVETIAEWTEPFRTCGSQSLSYHVMQNLPHIMRTLTGLTDED